MNKQTTTKEPKLIKCPDCTNAWYSKATLGYCPFCQKYLNFIIKL